VTSLDVYINFVLYAIYGRLTAADAIMRMAGSDIRRVADKLCEKHPFTNKPIYRGMLLDPIAQFTTDPLYTFISWSENQNIARWFACPHSTISEPLAEFNPKLRGYVVALPMPTTRVLFHHSWAKEFGATGLEQLAKLHPDIGAEGARQIEWSLRTQEEVITEPVAELSVQPVDIDHIELAALEQVFTPPWMRSLSSEVYS